MKTLVLDSNEIARDYTCTSLRYKLLEHNIYESWLRVHVPAVVLEETVANYARAVAKVSTSAKIRDREKNRLGLDFLGILSPDEYREYLLERFEERLGFTVLPWPTTSHQDLVQRAVSRTPPFSQSGGGYRDSLVWMDVVELARTGSDVVLVSADKAFSNTDGNLAVPLVGEIFNLPGSVELTADLGPWLLASLPWAVDDLSTAVSDSQDHQFFDDFLHSDLQEYLRPTVKDLGFEHSPEEVSIDDTNWGGIFERVHAPKQLGTLKGLTVVDYDIDQIVDVTAIFENFTPTASPWKNSQFDTSGRTVAYGRFPMYVRLTVLFGGDSSFSVEEIEWRRKDGTGSGPGVRVPNPCSAQLTLFD